MIDDELSEQDKKALDSFEKWFIECEECEEVVDKQIADKNGRVLCFDCYDKMGGKE